jgi:hypothetical protein
MLRRFLMSTVVIGQGALLLLGSASADFRDGREVQVAASQLNADAQQLVQVYQSFRDQYDPRVLEKTDSMKRYMALIQFSATASEVANIAQTLQGGPGPNPGPGPVFGYRPDLIAASQAVRASYDQAKLLWSQGFQSWGYWSANYDFDMSRLEQAAQDFMREPVPPPQPLPPPPPPHRLEVTDLALDNCLDLVIYANGRAKLATGAQLNDGGCHSTSSDSAYASVSVQAQTFGDRAFNPDFQVDIQVLAGRVQAQKLGVFNYSDGRALVIRLTDPAAGAATGNVLRLVF